VIANQTLDDTPSRRNPLPKPSASPTSAPGGIVAALKTELKRNESAKQTQAEGLWWVRQGGAGATPHPSFRCLAPLLPLSLLAVRSCPPESSLTGCLSLLAIGRIPGHLLPRARWHRAKDNRLPRQLRPLHRACSAPSHTYIVLASRPRAPLPHRQPLLLRGRRRLAATAVGILVQNGRLAMGSWRLLRSRGFGTCKVGSVDD